jgi:hypothetical protein
MEYGEVGGLCPRSLSKQLFPRLPKPKYEISFGSLWTKDVLDKLVSGAVA